MSACNSSPTDNSSSEKNNSTNSSNSSSSTTTSQKATSMTANEAIEKARVFINNAQYKIAFVSNTGVFGGSVQDANVSPEKGLMHPNGKAGQWVVEFFINAPTPISENGRNGQSYPYKKVLVTSQKADLMPEDTVNVPIGICELKPEYIGALEKARQLAISKNKTTLIVCQ